jgi:hypothetical protein
MVASMADLGADDVRQAAGTLRSLGYAEVADRLRQIAGRRKRDLAPLR